MGGAEQHTKPHDAFAKETLEFALGHLGRLEAQYAIASPTQHADIYFEPVDSKGLPGFWTQLADSPAIFEVFRQTPGLDACLDVLDKALSLHRRQRPRVSNTQNYTRARTWLISPGIPRGALKALGAKQTNGHRWSHGFYALPQGLKTHIVVLSQLPQTPETLPLRLMGRGHTQADAIKELLEMPQDNPTRAGLMECMVRWQASVLATHQTTRTNAQEELLMNVDQLVQKWRNEAWNQGIEKGIEQGIEKGIEKGIEEGIEKGRQKGLIEGRRQSAHLVLKGRFGDDHPWEDWLSRMDSPDAFDALMRLAIASEEAKDVVRWLESEVL